MKIGVLTYHCVPNFGAQLQATSTVGYLIRKGHEAVVLHWYPQDLEEMYRRRVPLEQFDMAKRYVEDKLPITEICRTEKELIHVINTHDIDAIVVGSDALFKYIPMRKRKFFSKKKLKFVFRKVLSVEQLEGNPFFGGFVEGINKPIPVVAFSVSSQNCAFYLMDKKERELMKKALKNYSLITVRDEWTKNMVEDILDSKDISITPDPVFSFNQNCFFNLPSKKEILAKYHLQDKYLLFSFSTWYTNESYIKELANEAEKRGFQAVAFPMPEALFDAGINSKIGLPLCPIDWYALIKYSSGYIGERMHPIVVCLHNGVPFFAYDEYGTIKKSFWGLKKKYVQNSSKTYRVLDRAGMIDFLYAYQTKQPIPEAINVIDSIQKFDNKKCLGFASNYQQLYEKSMNDNLKLFESQYYE